MIRIGQEAPAFTLPGSDGDSIKQYSLTEGTKDGPVILLFYPFDFSPVCTEALCNFRDAEWLTVGNGIDVWGISPDSAYSHQRFIQEYDFMFPLLSDRLGEVAERYGLLLEQFEHHPYIPIRSIIAIDSAQAVRYIWTTDDQYESPSLEIIESAIGWHKRNCSSSIFSR